MEFENKVWTASSSPNFFVFRLKKIPIDTFKGIVRFLLATSNPVTK